MSRTQTPHYDEQLASALLKSGDYKALAAYATPYASSGNTEAQVDLGRAFKLLGQERESNEWMEAAEESHFRGLTALWAAYSMMSLGPADLALRDQKAHFFQLCLAESGNAVACQTLAANYRHGLNGYPVDEDKAIHWFEKATQARFPNRDDA